MFSLVSPYHSCKQNSLSLRARKIEIKIVKKDAVMIILLMMVFCLFFLLQCFKILLQLHIVSVKHFYLCMREKKKDCLLIVNAYYPACNLNTHLQCRVCWLIMGEISANNNQSPRAQCLLQGLLRQMQHKASQQSNDKSLPGSGKQLTWKIGLTIFWKFRWTFGFLSFSDAIIDHVWVLW